jgi:N,N'-diacetyllegionaminate synthase
MKIADIDLDKQVFIIAEIGNNHEGDFGLAKEMIDCAAEAGADAVKFQTIVPEKLVSPSDEARVARLKTFQFSNAQFAELAQFARKAGVIFFSTPFDLESAKFLDTIQPVFKIASGDNTFVQLIETVAGFGKPMIVSTGLADMALLDRVYAQVHRVWMARGVNPGLALLHCIASYPAPVDQVNLAAIRTMMSHFTDCVPGYSDHVLGIKAATYAVAAGARVIEKHFTIDKNYSDFRDHQLSADPADMAELVKAIREVTAMMGTGEKTPQPCEADMQIAARRSITAARDIAAGTVLTAGLLGWVRPGGGLAPGNEGQLLGRATRRPLKAGDKIELKDLA